jgi:two-component system, OmpR family, response regulator QseB
MERERILVVEDDPALAQALATELGRAYETRVTHLGREALFLAETERFDAIVLDLTLPDIDGLEVAEQLQGTTAAIVMLTARADVQSRIAGLYAGASDYVAKPFVMEELLARLYAQLRQRRGDDHLRVGPVDLVPSAHTCSVHGEALALSAREFALLELLASAPGRIYSKDALCERLYEGEPPASNAIEALVSRLRAKLAEAGASDLIETVRGLGYVLRERP